MPKQEKCNRCKKKIKAWEDTISRKLCEKCIDDIWDDFKKFKFEK
jgi:hypothetical protein